MYNKTEKALFRAAVLTFEELGFLLPNQELDEIQKDAGVDASVDIEFRGPFSGRLVVMICGGVGPAIAANMLGEDEPPPLDIQRDALGEIGNVICGNALPLIAGKEEVFHLSPPVVKMGQDSFDGGHSALASVRVQVGLDEGRADVMLFVTSGEPALAYAG